MTSTAVITTAKDGSHQQISDPPRQLAPAAAGMGVLRRNGSIAEFDPGRIAVAITKAFLAVEGESAGRSSRLRAQVVELTDAVVGTLSRRYGADAPGRPVDLEEVQDQVELALMRGGHAAVARAYILYREEHRRARGERTQLPAGESVSGTAGFTVNRADGTHSSAGHRSGCRR